MIKIVEKDARFIVICSLNYEKIICGNTDPDFEQSSIVLPQYLDPLLNALHRRHFSMAPSCIV